MKPERTEEDWDDEEYDDEFEYASRVAMIEAVLSDMMEEGMVERFKDEDTDEYRYRLTDAGAKVAAQSTFEDKMALLVPDISP